MKLINATRMVTGYTVACDKTGREWLVVVAKGTYGIPDHPEQEPQLLEEQVPLVMADIFTGEPGFSSPLYEVDFATRKTRCDVLLNGSCYAPYGRPAREVTVGLRVGSLTKSFKVVGPRAYEAGILTCNPGEPKPFIVLPITYDNAFGGVDQTNEDLAGQHWYPENHAGVGYYPKRTAKELDGKPLPNTEELDDPVSRPGGSYKPMAFGPVGRAWKQRIGLAGSYDKKWLDNQFPFFPEDFDERYFQSAPEDQQVDYPRGGEEVVLLNLTPAGRTAFRIPNDLGIDVLFVPKDGKEKGVSAIVDTVVLEPDKSRFTLSWRASLPLRRNLFEVREGVVGWTAEQSQKARDERTRGKRRFSSLADLVAWERKRQPGKGV